jgi:hypothetical protein
LTKIYNKEGVAGLFTGVGPDTVKSVADAFLFFLFYNYLRTNKVITNKALGHGSELPAWDELTIGARAGAASKFFTTPISNIATRAKTSHKNASITEIAQGIQQEKGLLGFWSGYEAALILTINPALTFAFYELLKRALPGQTTANPGARTTFLLAAVSKSLATAITYPFQLAKARAQASPRAPIEKTADQVKAEAQAAGHSIHAARDIGRRDLRDAARESTFATVARIYREEGIESLYAGLGAEVLKGFFSHGITMLVKEQVHGLIIQLYFKLQSLYARVSPKTEAQKLAEGASNQASTIGEAAKSQAQQAYEKAQQAGSDAYNKAAETGNAVYASAQETGNAAYSKITETGSAVYEKASDLATGTAKTGKPDPVYDGAIRGPGASGNGTAARGPGAQSHAVYDATVNKSQSSSSQPKTFEAGKAHSVYDQSVNAQKTQDAVLSRSGDAEPMGKRTFPKDSAANKAQTGERSGPKEPGTQAHAVYDKTVTGQQGPGAGAKSDHAGQAHSVYDQAVGAQKTQLGSGAEAGVGNTKEMDTLREKKGAGN